MSTFGIPGTLHHAIDKQYRAKMVVLNRIPRDEVSLTSSGRCVCLVCSWKPVLDTAQVLSIHRSGKKHKEQYKIWKKNKRERIRQNNNQRKRPHNADESTEDASNPSKRLRTETPNGEQPYPRYLQYSNLHNYEYNYETIPDVNPDQMPVNYPQTMPDQNTDVQDPQENNTLYYSSERPSSTPSQPIFDTGNLPPPPQPMDPITHQRINEYYNDCRSKGWKVDANGHLYKDENVEFDSDEEPPTPPADLGIKVIVAEQKTKQPNKNTSTHKQHSILGQELSTSAGDPQNQKALVKRKLRKEKQKERKKNNA